MNGTVVVFTGFRDEDLKARIEAKGGRVASAVSGATDILVADGSKGVLSAKAKAAAAKGVRVVSREEFVEAHFGPSIMQRLFLGKKKSDAKASKAKCYLTLDNGGRPFKVCYDSSRFWVMMPDDLDADKYTYGKVAVEPTRYRRALVGRSPRNAMTEFSGGYGPKFDGNSMLFETANTKTTTNTYVYVGERVCSFDTAADDRIVSYVSPVGNSGVPYPYAVGESNTYLLIEDAFVPNADLPKGADPYEYLYMNDCKHACRGDRACVRRCMAKSRALQLKLRWRTKTVVPRLF